MRIWNSEDPPLSSSLLLSRLMSKISVTENVWDLHLHNENISGYTVKENSAIHFLSYCRNIELCNVPRMFLLKACGTSLCSSCSIHPCVHRTVSLSLPDLATLPDPSADLSLTAFEHHAKTSRRYVPDVIM